MKKFFLGKHTSNLVGRAATLPIISLIVAIPFIVTLPSFAAPASLIQSGSIQTFCNSYKQTPPISVPQCVQLLNELSPQDVPLLQNPNFLSALLSTVNAPLIQKASGGFTSACQSFGLFPPPAALASCTKQAENFANFMNRIDPGNNWPIQSLQTLATGNSLLDGTAKIKDQKHFVGAASTFNHGLKTILLTGVLPTDKLDITGFIGKLWAFQHN